MAQEVKKRRPKAEAPSPRPPRPKARRRKRPRAKPAKKEAEKAAEAPPPTVPKEVEEKLEKARRAVAEAIVAAQDAGLVETSIDPPPILDILIKGYAIDARTLKNPAAKKTYWRSRPRSSAAGSRVTASSEGVDDQPQTDIRIVNPSAGPEGVVRPARRHPEQAHRRGPQGQGAGRAEARRAKKEETKPAEAKKEEPKPAETKKEEAKPAEAKKEERRMYARSDGSARESAGWSRSAFDALAIRITSSTRGRTP